MLQGPSSSHCLFFVFSNFWCVHEYVCVCGRETSLFIDLVALWTRYLHNKLTWLYMSSIAGQMDITSTLLVKIYVNMVCKHYVDHNWYSLSVWSSDLGDQAITFFCFIFVTTNNVAGGKERASLANTGSRFCQHYSTLPVGNTVWTCHGRNTLFENPLWKLYPLMQMCLSWVDYLCSKAGTRHDAAPCSIYIRPWLWTLL